MTPQEAVDFLKNDLVGEGKSVCRVCCSEDGHDKDCKGMEAVRVLQTQLDFLKLMESWEFMKL